MTIPSSPTDSADDPSAATDERNRIARLERPRSIFDIFKKEYEVNLLIDGNALLRSGDPLALGINLDMSWLDSDGQAIQPEILALLRELKPAALRLELGSDITPIQPYLTLCRMSGAAPYLSLDLSRLEPNALNPILDALREAKKADGFETVTIELDVRGFVSKEEGAVESAAARVRSVSETLRAADLDERLMLSGAALFENFSRLWFENCLKACVDVVDQVGFSWALFGSHAAPSDASPVETAVICAAAVERLIRLAKKTYSSDAEARQKPIVLTSWAYARAGEHNRHADAFYVASVLDALSAEARFTCHCINLSALLTRVSDGTWTETASAFALRLNQQHFAARVSWRVVRDEPMPSVHCTGLPGVIEPFELPDAAMSISRSADRTQLRLIVQNRHPRKRLYLRAHFANLPDMRPTSAQVIRAGTGSWPRRYFENRDSTPTLKTIALPKFRAMDHVNIDLPPLGLIQMELTSAPT